MREPIEQLSEEQLVHIVVLLEDDKKNEALAYIVKNSSLNEQQARDVIAAILMEHDAALQQQTSGPRFTDDLPEQQVETGNLTDSIAISIPRQNDQLSDSPTSPLPPATEELQEKVAEPESTPTTPHLIWIAAGIIIFILLLIWILD